MCISNRRRSFFPLVATVFLALASGIGSGTVLAAGVAVPKGTWEVRVITKVNNQFLRGPVAYVFGITLKEGGVGRLTASLEYTGTPITEGLFKGSKHVQATIARPITSATRNAANKLFVYNGGTFKLVSGDPPGHTIKEYATAGGLLPEAQINSLIASFYGVIIYTISGEDLMFEPKEKGARKIVWKKVP